MNTSFIKTQNPATEQTLNEYATMCEKHIEKIIQATHKAQNNWADIQIHERAKLFYKLKEVLLEHKEKAALLITTEMGKPISEALSEIEKCALLCEYYAEQGPVFLQPQPITTQFKKSYRCFEPLGIILAIMPWNFPFWQVFRFAVPNLLAGNAGLLKHAPITTGCGLMIEDLFLKAGFPEHLFRSLVIDVNQVPYVIHHPHVHGVTLTGSNASGKIVATEAGIALKKVVLELGGSDPYLILDDADIELAATQCVTARYRNAGQVCIAPKRLIVTPKVKKQFEQRILEIAKTFYLDDPLLPSTTMGPMAREDLRSKIHVQVSALIKEGANCALGGYIPKHQGFYYPPTVLLNIKPTSKAYSEELFGPVICVTEALNEADAIKLANQTEFGLGAAVFTQDLQKGEHIASCLLKAGTCMVNTAVFSDPRLPFGGIKQSGFGRELSQEGLHEFVNIKTVVIN